MYTLSKGMTKESKTNIQHVNEEIFNIVDVD